MGPPNSHGFAGKVAAENTAKERLRREDHLRVKHDKLFSEWKILVGPADWKDHAAGEEGSQRYRLHNLPAAYFGPGVYELGLTQHNYVATQDPKERKLRRHAVVVVYLGQADNVRQRLQRYGQTGSHLEGYLPSGSISAIEENVESDIRPLQSVEVRAKLRDFEPEHEGKGTGIPGGLRLFTEVFSRGYSIAFRWARTETKQIAQRVESELLHVFDYPWNTSLNGARRPRDILTKLEMLQYHLNRSLCLGRALGIGWRKWEYLDKKVGISVAVRKPMEEAICNPARPKFSIFSPSPTEARGGGDGGRYTSNPICGVLLDNGSTCGSPPVKGRRRCSVHKGLRAKLSTRRTPPKTPLSHVGDVNTGKPSVVTIRAQVKGKRVEITDVSGDGLFCGAIVDGGSPCLNLPVKGRKRCSYHKGIRLTKIKSKTVQKVHSGLSSAKRTSTKFRS